MRTCACRCHKWPLLILLCCCLQNVSSERLADYAKWRPSGVEEFNAALRSWYSDSASNKSTYGPIGTWDVAHFVDSTSVVHTRAEEIVKYRRARADCSWESEAKQAWVDVQPTFLEYGAVALEMGDHITQPYKYGPPPLTEGIRRCRRGLPDGSAYVFDRVQVTSSGGDWPQVDSQTVALSALPPSSSCTLAYDTARTHAACTHAACTHAACTHAACSHAACSHAACSHARWSRATPRRDLDVIST